MFHLPDAQKAGAAWSVNGDSNQQVAQPRLVEDSYPLAGPDDRRKTAELLQQLTVDLLAKFDVYKRSHWNLTGPEYQQLHEYYAHWADYYRLQADVFAERVLQMGYSVDGRWGTVARTTKLPEYPDGRVTDGQTLRLLVERVTVLQKEVYKDIHATEKSDPPTSNLLQDLAHNVDKNLWQLRAHVERPGSLGGRMPWASHLHPPPAGPQGQNPGKTK